MTAQPLQLTLEVDGRTVLAVQSDGLAHFTVTGILRFGETILQTDNDHEVFGIVAKELSARFSQEVIRRALAEHEVTQ